MNSLILIKGEDKTNEIKSIKELPEIKKTEVVFNNGKAYRYNSSNVTCLKVQKTCDCNDGESLIVDGRVRFDVSLMQDYGTHLRVCYRDGRTETVRKDMVQTIQREGSNLPSEQDKMEYLKELAEAIGLTAGGVNLLASNFDKLKYVSKDSILYSYLHGALVSDNTAIRQPEDKVIIYPFGFNLSQKKAVENAVQNRISVIQGPPGTGKTQTILNIIANAVINGESVAVVSNNNTAITNVYDKLSSRGISFIAAVLGNRENKNTFVEKQETEIRGIEKWRSFNITQSELRRSFAVKERVLNQKLKLNNQLSDSRLKLEALKKEYHHFEDAVDTDDRQIFKKALSSGEILSFLSEYEQMLEQGGTPGLLKKIRWYFRYGIRQLSALMGEEPALIVDDCEKAFYIRRLDELVSNKERLEKELDEYDFERTMREYSALSLNYLREYLAGKYPSGKHAQIYDVRDLKQKSEAFIRDYPVVLSTTFSLRSSLAASYMYDYVIIDEASQVDLATGALALSCAKKAVVVGDMKQLPNVVDSESAKKALEISSRHMIDARYEYTKNSILSSVIKVFQNAPTQLLREHYRCAPAIINFCNRRFYNDELIILTKENKNRQPLKVVRTVAGNHARGHLNQRQIDVILKEVLPSLQLKEGETVGVVTPYRNQADELKKVLNVTGIQADTVDKYQGQERSVMVFSTVDNEIGDFAADPNRLNVAVSRAIDQFIVVTDGNDNDKTSAIHDLISYIEYNNYEITESAVSSVFDNLYKNYDAARKETIRKYGAVSEYDSENLMHAAIQEELEKGGYTKYGLSMHVPLRHLIRETARLNEREAAFVANVHSHLDFLIYSKMDYLPVLAIEVDGYQFHDANPVQLERDRTKDAILAKYAIPLERFSTIGSGEKERLASIFNAILEKNGRKTI